MTGLLAEVLAVSELAAEQQAEMLALMQRYFRGVVPAVFACDLAEKAWAVLLTDPHTGRLVGFSTISVLADQVDGVPVRAFFSGDTIIDRAHWGSLSLERAWIRQAFALIDREPDARWYWFLICKGYRTYRFLPVYFHHYYPSPEPTPVFAQAVLDRLALRKFGPQYDARRGVIRTPADYTLRPGVGDIGERELRDPRIRFFQQRNPGWVGGEELACLAELRRDNLKRMALRLLGREAGE